MMRKLEIFILIRQALTARRLLAFDTDFSAFVSLNMPVLPSVGMFGRVAPAPDEGLITQENAR